MRFFRFILQLMLTAFAALLLTGCPTGVGTTTNVRPGSSQNMADIQVQRYDGPKARIAVARFDNRSADASRWWNRSIGESMSDMLTTALVNSGRFIVLERDNLDDMLYEQDLGLSGRIREETAAAIGEIEGAELLVIATVSEFGERGGTQARFGASDLGRALGAITGGMRSAHMAVDLRVIDASTSRILAATSVEGIARDFNIGAALSEFTGGVSLDAALSSWQNTPREKALRQVIAEAVSYIISVTPASMMRYDSLGNLYDNPRGTTSADRPVSSIHSASAIGRAVITASSLNVRSGPGINHPAQYSISSGEMVDVLDRANGWLNIRDANRREGWISAQFAVEMQ